MSKKVFRPAPPGKWNQEAHISDQHSTEYFCARGYHAAADMLVKMAVQSDNHTLANALFFPICFNYRHYLELSLKKLILGLEKYYPVLEEFAETKGKLENSISSGQLRGHNLEKLLRWLIERFSLVTDEHFDPDVRGTIIEIHKMDPDGQNFRYPLRMDGKLALPTGVSYDLENIRSRMEKVELYLSGMDLWMYEESRSILEFAHEMQEYHQDHYEDYYEQYEDYYEDLNDYNY